ncbi:MAG: hypothetical protein ACOWWH_12640 [Eubacteriaceae bacterium]
MIENPVGVDAPIQMMQQLFISNLWLNVGTNNKEFNHRVFGINKNGKIRPFVLIDNTNDYKEVSFSDNKSVLGWFYAYEELNSYNKRQISRNVDVFFAVNLNDLYSELRHRTEEEVYRDVQKVLLMMPSDFEITNIVSGSEAYGIFDNLESKKINMHPWHVFKFECVVKYQLNCK